MDMNHGDTQRFRKRGRMQGRLLPFLALAAALWSLAFSSPSVEADTSPAYLVIVHPANRATRVSRDFVAQAFLKRVTRWEDGETIRPVDQSSDARPRQAFSLAVLNRSVDAVRSYWQQRIFSGRDLPPPEFDSDEAVVRYVSSTRGALGYISARANLLDTKTLTID
jgi:ABC-type phosphate transport system substrate-binding protein